MARLKTPVERGLSTDDGRITVGQLVRFGSFTYRVVEVRKNFIRAMGDNGSVLCTEPECLEVIE